MYELAHAVYLCVVVKKKINYHGTVIRGRSFFINVTSWSEHDTRRWWQFSKSMFSASTVPFLSNSWPPTALKACGNDKGLDDIIFSFLLGFLNFLSIFCIWGRKKNNDNYASICTIKCLQDMDSLEYNQMCSIFELGLIWDLTMIWGLFKAFKRRKSWSCLSILHTKNDKCSVYRW